jgi:hypothetical protein
MWLILGGLILGSACNRVGLGGDEGATAEASGTGGDGDGDGDYGDGDADDEDHVDAGDGDGDTGCPPYGCLDIGDDPWTDPPPCAFEGVCIDVLFVIDNSGTMGEEQLNLSANFPLLIDKLLMLTDSEGYPLQADINIMVTTTDVGHPLCTPLQPDGYKPAQGAPQSEACINRLDDFTGLGIDAASIPEACTNGCPVALEPVDPFINFHGAMNTNVPGNDIAGTLSCIGPQGINGCGYQAPLEAMLMAIDPAATWNQGDRPFLREGSILAIAIITDDVECSVQSPEGYAYFTDPMQNSYWEVNPDTGTKTHATSAVCQNAGVSCGAPDANGVYADCSSTDNGVLHPLDRYLTYLQDELIADQNKEVMMLGILGVPPVTTHNDQPPYQPIAGGVNDLVYRQWKDGPYPMGDLLPEDIENGETAATKEFEFGLGPGCTGEDGMGGFTGQAIPNVRVQEVCQGLDEGDRIRCCIESVCDNDFSAAMSCLTGMIQSGCVLIF